MERRVLKYFLLLSLLAPLTLAAQRPAKGRKTVVQQPAPVSYDSLAMRRNELAGKEARLKGRLDEARELFSSDSPGKEALGANIVELEQALFDVRADLESLSETMARMEREQGFSLPVMPAATAAADNGKTMLVDNDYFRDNLSAADYKQLLAAQKKESEVAELIGKLQENYDQMALLLPVYHVAVKGPQADSLHARITALAAENERLAPAIGDLWQSVFDTKVYAYNYVLDKNGESDILAVQEKQMNNMLLLEAEIEGEYMYEEVARYALQKLLIAGYEIRIADRAGLTGAADSLNSLTPPTSHIDDYFLPVLDTRERMFYDFADAQIVRPAKYANINQVPQVEIFPRGSMYRILLGAYSRPQPVSVFRNVYPLSQETKADRKHYYYAGGYATYAEAEEAAARLKRQGFRNPRVVAWHDGLYDAAPGAESGSAVTEPSGQTTRIRYRVEIGGAGESLSRVVRDVISTQAAGKEVSRTADPETGEPLFVVGSFNNKTLSEALVQDIDTVEPGLTIRIVAVQ